MFIILKSYVKLAKHVVRNRGFKTRFSMQLKALARKTSEREERKVTLHFPKEDFYSENRDLSPDRL